MLKDWYNKYWSMGLPKRHDRMHYYLNAFPFGCGDTRRVGPESDPYSYMGEAKWLIEQVKL